MKTKTEVLEEMACAVLTALNKDDGHEDAVIAALRAADALGFVLVPRTLTNTMALAMVNTFRKAWDLSPTQDASGSEASAVWDAMLSASPDFLAEES